MTLAGISEGDIRNVRFYERVLGAEEISALSGDGEKEVNTPVLNWIPAAAKGAVARAEGGADRDRGGWC